ncbi:DUF6083 domain-containing protein [Streptomyces prunicolor]|uniref:DUF6083 domain-containing protein n=2 Tax=Streptomyces prunicolor TaxID=67348 RepID=UPI0033C47B8F
MERPAFTAESSAASGASLDLQPPAQTGRRLRGVSAVRRRSLVAGCTFCVVCSGSNRCTHHAFRPMSLLARRPWAIDPRGMGALGEGPRRLRDRQSRCLYCGLLADRVATLDHDWVLLEPEMEPLAHTVPAEHRWIVLSDGRVTVYGVCPPDPFQRCRIEHRLACSAQPLPDLWPWLTSLRVENGRQVERQKDPESPQPPETLPDTG